jgi:hypothetical protein
MNFKKWLEFSDMGGVVSHDHMNNQVSGDKFNKISSKWMARSAPEETSTDIPDKIFRKKKKKI